MDMFNSTDMEAGYCALLSTEVDMFCCNVLSSCNVVLSSVSCVLKLFDCCSTLSTAAALEVVKCRYPEVKTFHEWVPTYSSKPLDSEEYDVDQDNDNSLVQRGRRPSSEEWERMKSSLQSMFARGEVPDGWTADELDYLIAIGDEVPNGLSHQGVLDVWIHTMSKVKGTEIITSTEHGRAHTRASYYIQVCAMLRCDVLRHQT